MGGGSGCSNSSTAPTEPAKRNDNKGPARPKSKPAGGKAKVGGKKRDAKTTGDGPATPEEEKRTKIAIIIYTLHGHVATLAESMKQGVESTGAVCTIFQVPETLSEDLLEHLGAPPKPDYPIMTAKKMPEYDGFVFGVSGRYGIMSAQMKAFMDTTGGLWKSGALVGKAAGTFVSTGQQGGGQETANLANVSFFAHHGMVFVPMGVPQGYFDSSSEMQVIKVTSGGSPYGAGTFAGRDNSRQPSDYEKNMAVCHGEIFASTAAKLAK